MPFLIIASTSEVYGKSTQRSLLRRLGQRPDLRRDRGRETIDCGTGRDRVIADRIDGVLATCERVSFRRSC